MEGGDGEPEAAEGRVEGVLGGVQHREEHDRYDESGGDVVRIVGEEPGGERGQRATVEELLAEGIEHD